MITIKQRQGRYEFFIPNKHSPINSISLFLALYSAKKHSNNINLELLDGTVLHNPKIESEGRFFLLLSTKQFLDKEYTLVKIT